MSSNPTLDRFWREFHAAEPSSALGGIDADKPGYHEKRDDLLARGRTGDYSIAQVAADRRGSGTVAAAIDITLPDAAMRKYTGRLRAAALTHDERLYVRVGPTLREYIGTTNGSTVECYVFTGGVPLGVGSDSGFDAGRDPSHLWHIHLSVIREHAQDWPALDAVLSVLRGESLAAWRARTEDDMTPDQAKQLGDVHWATAAGIPSPTGAGTVPHQVWAAWMTGTVKALANSLATGNAGLAAKLREIDDEATARAVAEEQRDADLKTLVGQGLSGERDATEVLRLIGERLIATPSA